MREVAPGRIAYDDCILESPRRRPGDVRELARQFPQRVPTSRIRTRMRVLAQAGYVAPIATDYEQYEITAWGRRYLEGEGRADLLTPEPSPALATCALMVRLTERTRLVFQAYRIRRIR